MAGRGFKTTANRSRLMGQVRQADTSAERRVRGELRRLGVGYRLQAKDLPGTPDIVNRSRKWAILVHGCFWHQHEGCQRSRLPKRNQALWVEKFEANKRRDWQGILQLLNLGYSVLVVWECETLNPWRLRTVLTTFLSSLRPRQWLNRASSVANLGSGKMNQSP